MFDKKNYDFSCYVVKYDQVSINGKRYQKDSLDVNNGIVVPLMWNHNHNDPTSVLGRALLENRDDGLYCYCEFIDSETTKIAKELIQDKGLLSISPCIANVAYLGNYIVCGSIREVSLVYDRVDRDESYYPELRKGL